MSNETNTPHHPQQGKRYDITCPSCGYEATATPSMFHLMGAYELGGGTCPACQEMFEIHYQSSNDTMATVKINKEFWEQCDE